MSSRKLQEEIIRRFDSVQKEHDIGQGRNVPVYELIKQLDLLNARLGDFENLLERYYLIEDTSEDEFETFDNWKDQFCAVVLSLGSSLDKPKVSKDKKKSNFMTIFKKRDPPKFTGDHLEYLEWKDKWKAMISANKPDLVYELDILKENIPEQGKKKLFGCESITKCGSYTCQ